MKKLMAALAVLGVLAGGMQTVSAGDREWATAGKVLTGVVAGAVIARALEPAPVYAYSTTYYPSPVYVQPSPVVVYPAPICARPAAVVVYRPPPPLVSFSVRLGAGHYYRPHHRICR